MRVAVNAWFWDSPTTGSGQYTRRLVEHLAQVAPRLEITLVAPEAKIPTPGAQATNARLRPTADRHWLTANLHKLWFEQVTFPHTGRRLCTDVAHVPYWAPPIRPAVPTVVTIHDLIPLLLPEYRGGPLMRLYTALVSRAARSATLVLADSEASKRDIVAHLGLPGECVRVVYLAADGPYTPAPAPGDAAVRARYGVPDRYVLYLGGFDVRKNIATVVQAYREAQPVIGEMCPLVIAGRLPERETPFAPDPRRLAREHAADERYVHFVDSPEGEDKPALYRGAVAFIFPSRYEGFGLPPLEALACGTPVVASYAASLPEVVGDGGVLLPPGDAEGMAQALIRLVTDHGYRAQMSRRALAQAARFSWERTARETLAAYRDALG